MPKIPVNTARAKWAEKGLEAFAEVADGSLEEDEVYGLVKDFLADLAHFCDLRGLPFYELVNEAAELHRDEVREEADVLVEVAA